MNRTAPPSPGGRAKAFAPSYDDGALMDGRLLGLCRGYGAGGVFDLNGGRPGKAGYLRNRRLIPSSPSCRV